MNTAPRIMANKRFGYFILASFLAATLLLLIIQYNFSRNMNTMIGGNEKLVTELRSSNHLREVDRDILGVESRIRAAIATNDISHLEGVDNKIAMVVKYLDSIDTIEPDEATEKYLGVLRGLAKDKITAKDKLTERYYRLGNMNDTSFIANPRARKISDQITSVTQKIYDIRQKKMVGLSQHIVKGSKKARLYGDLLIVFMFISGAILCWFIYNQFRQQNRMIIKLDSSEKTARDALQIKENFLANMSHEIRTPLNSILGFTNLLKRRERDATSAEFVDSIQTAGENLMAIINDILDLSKIEAGMMRIVAAPFSVRGLTQSIETLFKERIKEKGLWLKSSVADDVPDTLIGDATRLTQILVNLIGNALKFSEKGTIEIDVFKQFVNGKTINLGVRVKDAGIGIEEGKLHEIFERFNQAEDSITRNYGGTGLGLAIVKTLVQLQNGSIEVKSIPNQGTEFLFFIPYTIAEEQIAHDVQSDDVALNSHINHSLQLLVVDDNVMNQSLMKHLLSQWGATFSIAANGLEAVEILKQQSFDLVMMDIQMPKMDGYSATRYIRDELKLDVPIIAMTAHAMAGEREKCLSNGMNEYVSKPINEDLLFKMITKFVTNKPILGNAQAADMIPDFKVIDLWYMKEISRGNLEYERLITSQFVNIIPVDFIQLSDAFKKGEIKKIRSIAHNLKTSVSMMGLLQGLEPLLDKIENTEVIDSEINDAFKKLQSICLAAVEEAKVFLLSLPHESV